MTKKYEGVVELGGKKFTVSVVDGVRYIEGQTIDEFMESCSTETLHALSKLGAIAMQDSISGKKVPAKKYQYLASEFTKDINL